LSDISPFTRLWTALSKTTVTVATIIEDRFIIQLFLIWLLQHQVSSGQTYNKESKNAYFILLESESTNRYNYNSTPVTHRWTM
jgi:hypothetical protein